MTDIDELERIARAATPGPWRDTGFGDIQPVAGGALVATTVTNGGCLPNYGANTAYIEAANPAIVLDLIERLRAAQADTFAAQQALITEGMERDRLAAQNAELRAALCRLIRGYVNCLEAGRDRIKSLGGRCDTVTYMENHDPWLREARAVLAKTSPTTAG